MWYPLEESVIELVDGLHRKGRDSLTRLSTPSRVAGSEDRMSNGSAAAQQEKAYPEHETTDGDCSIIAF
jgi:hypothetical protein